MIMELSRLLIGLLVVVFHRPIARTILRCEESIAHRMAAKGWHVPSFPCEKTVHDLYFCLGVFICCFSIGRIYLAL